MERASETWCSFPTMAAPYRHAILKETRQERTSLVDVVLHFASKPFLEAVYSDQLWSNTSSRWYQRYRFEPGLLYLALHPCTILAKSCRGFNGVIIWKYRVKCHTGERKGFPALENGFVLVVVMVMGLLLLLVLSAGYELWDLDPHKALSKAAGNGVLSYCSNGTDTFLYSLATITG